MNEALSEARRPGHAHTLAQVLQTAPFVECYTGSPDEARGDAEEATEVSNQSVLLGLGNYCSWALTDKVSRFEDQRGKAQNREIRRLVMTPPVTAVSMSWLKRKSVTICIVPPLSSGLPDGTSHRCILSRLQGYGAVARKLGPDLYYRVKADFGSVPCNEKGGFWPPFVFYGS